MDEKNNPSNPTFGPHGQARQRDCSSDRSEDDPRTAVPTPSRSTAELKEKPTDEEDNFAITDDEDGDDRVIQKLGVEADKLAPLRASPLPCSNTQPGSVLGGASLRRGNSRRMSGTEVDQLEIMLRTQTRESGKPAHHGEIGVLEKTTQVDIGDGPEDVIMVEWLPNDPECPFNWSKPRKYLITACVCYLTALTAVNATSVGVMTKPGMEYFGVSHERFVLSNFNYLFAVAVTPLVLAPMSELFGRNVIYHVTSIFSALLFVPQALSHDFGGVLAARWFQGMMSSVGNSMVGGTLADIFVANERGGPMNLFAISIFVGQSLGGVIFGWVAMNLSIPWCYGLQAIFGLVAIIFNALVLRETRSDVLLSRRAKRLTKETGLLHLCAADLQKKSFLTLVTHSAIRPLQYLWTEPIVSAMSLWISFAWGCIFLATGTSLQVFGQYGWNAGLTGTIQITTLLGGLLGYISNFHQEYLYKRAVDKSPNGRAPPEARLYWAATGGLLFPLATYAYAWTGTPEIHWIAPAIFLTLSLWGVYVMYISVFNYLADVYEQWSSSAQAAQSFARNVFSAVFPLFAKQMYDNMGYAKASTTVGSVAVLLSAAPILLIFYGATLRKRSKVASAIWAAETAAGKE